MNSTVEKEILKAKEQLNALSVALLNAIAELDVAYRKSQQGREVSYREARETLEYFAEECQYFAEEYKKQSE